MIAVFVSYENRIETLHVLADHREPPRDLFRAQSRVDEHASVTGNDQHCITSRAAAKNSKFHRPQKGTKGTKQKTNKRANRIDCSLYQSLCAFCAFLWLDLQTRTIDIEAVEISQRA